MYLKALFIVCTLILLEIIGWSSANFHDELIVTLSKEIDSEAGVQDNGCNNELLKLKNELDGLKEDFQFYKESQLEAIYFIPERIEIICQAMIKENVQDLRNQMNFLQDHILNVQLLEKISNQILSTLLQDSNMTKKILTLFSNIFPPRVHLEVFESLFNHLDSIGYLQKLSNLQDVVKLIKPILSQLKNNTYNPSSAWTRETEEKFVTTLIANLLSQNDNETWADLSRWLSPDFFSVFLHLSEEQVYKILLDTFEIHFEDKLLTNQQLQYIKELYYYSFLSRNDNPSKIMTLATIRSSLVNHKEWSKRKQVFSRPLIFNSIDRDILSRVTPNLTDVTTIGLNYLKNELSSDEIWIYGFDENDIWFCRVTDVLLHAMQSGVMTYEPKDLEFWKLINHFNDAKSVLFKYPFLIDDVKSVVVDMYNNQSQNLPNVLKFMQTIQTNFLLEEGLKQLLSVMRESEHLFKIQVFQLANFLMTYNFHHHSIWNELSEMVQILCDYSWDKGLLWFLQDSQEGVDLNSKAKYQISANGEYFIELKPLSIDHPTDDNTENQQVNETMFIWVFDTSLNPSNLPRTQISLADTSPYGGIVVDQNEDGNQFLRHVKNFRDRRNGKFAIFEPVLSVNGESFQLHFGSDSVVSVLYSMEEPKRPIQLILKNKLDSSTKPAQFTVQREQ